jgi:hypothetical protein
MDTSLLGAPVGVAESFVPELCRRTLLPKHGRAFEPPSGRPPAEAARIVARRVKTTPQHRSYLGHDLML